MISKRKKKIFITTAIILFTSVGVSYPSKSEADTGGIKVRLLPNPKPQIIIDTSKANTQQYLPIKLKGVIDNSATNIASLLALSSTGLSFICDVYFSSQSGADLSPQNLRANIEDAFKNVPDTFKLVLDKLPNEPATISNMEGFNPVKTPSGKDALRFTMRGNSEKGVTSMVKDYYWAGLPLDYVENTITFSCNRNFVITPIGLPNDESPNKINTKSHMIPSRNNKITGTAEFYNWDQCGGDWTLGKWSSIYLLPTAKISQTLSVDIPTWSEYLSPWDSEGEYNLDKSAFNEVKGVTSQLPGGYLTPVINWNLKKDGPPTAEKVAKRFGRIVNYFDKTVDKKESANVTAQETKTSQGKDFVLSDTSSNILKRPVTIKTIFKAEPIDFTPHLSEVSISDRQKLSLMMGVNAPTSKTATLWEAIDNGKFKEVETYDLSKDNPVSTVQKKVELPGIRQKGNHTLHLKLTDSNGLESKVKDLQVKVDERQLVTKDTEITQYNDWDKTSGIVSVKDRQGNLLNPEQVLVTGLVDTSKTGKYPITYSYDGLTNQATVTVRKSSASLNVKDVALTVGDKFDPKIAFVSAKDNDGKELPFEKIKVTGADEVNVRKSGDYKVTYELGEIAPIKRTATVHIEKGGLSLSKLPKIQFPTLQLDGKRHEVSPQIKSNALVITDRRGINSAGWQLQAKYERVTSGWDKSGFNLLASLTTKAPGLDIPQNQFTFKNEAQVVCAVPDKSLSKALINSEIELSPKLQVPAQVLRGQHQAIISWNLVEAPEE